MKTLNVLLLVSAITCVAAADAAAVDKLPALRLSGTYLLSGSGTERTGINPDDFARAHAGLTGYLDADGAGNAQIVLYTNATDAFGITDGFATSKTCTYVEGNPGPQNGRLLCELENPITKVVLAFRYTINRSGQKATAVGVIFIYDKIPEGIILTKVSALTFQLDQERM